MDERQFWQQKIIQFFHDPPGKPFVGFLGAGKHTDLAKKLFDVFQTNNQKRLRYFIRTPDWASAGADRPLVSTPRLKGVAPISVAWRKGDRSFITHPLAPGFRLMLPVPPSTEVEPRDVEEGSPEEEEGAHPWESLRAEQLAIAKKLGKDIGDWNDVAQIQKAYVKLWRRFRDDLVDRRIARSALAGDSLWEEMPSDTRCPDHSIWDHLKVTTALAFMKPHWMFKPVEWLEDRWDEGAREPWLLRMSLGPTQAFIAESRTSRDLWVSSFLLADLAWHAMEPFVEQYGPDCIVYPDLRGNPRADCWLYEHYRDALADEANPGTFAAVLPNAFVALIPRGGEDGHLHRIDELAEKAQAAVRERWKTLADIAESWITGIRGDEAKPDRHWRKTWRRQHGQPPVYCVWSAVPWRPMGHIADAANLRGRALPVQSEGFREAVPDKAAQAQRDEMTIAARRERLAPWIPKETWAHYEWAREVYALSNLQFHQMERGFDYALTHHQLSVRHHLRKATAPGVQEAEEPGEKCTLCGRREALRADGENGDLENVRHLARRFWSHKELDPDETGAERLCGVCALKRFLVEADQDLSQKDSFNATWAGMASGFEDVADPGGRRGKAEIRLPFPSTATITGQHYLEAVVRAAAEPTSSLRPHIAKIVAACKAAGLPRTSFPRALPRLAPVHEQVRASGNKDLQAFLEYEAEDVLFPETADGKAHALGARGKKGDAEKLASLKGAVLTLRQATREQWKNDSNPPATPGKQIAVIRLDGDHTGRLLLGDADAIGTRWKDVLHPDAVEQIKKNAHLLGSGWADLLDAKRLMGPSLHAFISRALAGFSHRIVPWVVEQEFSGRLIYSGGDDVLCLAPAGEALDLAARLQQLYSAAWVVDTDDQRGKDQWAWRRRGWTGTYDQKSARLRFMIPLSQSDGEGRPLPIRLPVEKGEQVENHSADDKDWTPRLPAQGPLLPMLGRHASLSAGIAVGHYKTPLRVLLERSKDLLECAKTPFGADVQMSVEGWRGRRAVAVGHASRGGEKTHFILPWSEPGQAPEAHRTLRCGINAFEKGWLPSRLPYKLRELAVTAKYGLERIDATIKSSEECKAAKDRLLKGLFDSCLDEPGWRGAEEARAIWEQGIALYPKDPERYTDGLLFCRALAGGGQDEGEN